MLNSLNPLNHVPYLQKMVFLKEFLSYAKNPSAEAVESFIHFTKRVRRSSASPAVQEMLNHIFSDPKAKKLVQERYLPRSLKTNELLAMAPGTLGYELGRHLKDNGLETEIYAQFKIESDIEYISFRGGQLHDLFHVIAGYGVDHFGEFAVQAFTLAQTRSPLVAVFLAGDLLYASRQGADWSFKAMQAMADGFLKGSRCQNLFAIPWEESFTKNLTDIRKDCGLN